jgi:hypothetical protein
MALQANIISKHEYNKDGVNYVSISLRVVNTTTSVERFVRVDLPYSEVDTVNKAKQAIRTVLDLRATPPVDNLAHLNNLSLNDGEL